MRKIVDDVQKGYFAVGLVLGVCITLVFASAFLTSNPEFAKGWLQNAFWALFGFGLSLPLSIFQARTAAKQRLEDKIELFADVVEERYNQVRKHNPALVEIIAKNKNGLQKIPLQEYLPNGRDTLLPLLSYTDAEWEKVSEIKGYFKKLAILTRDSGFPKEKVEVAVNRGASDYFYQIWALTVHKFYLVRDPLTHAGQLTEDNFKKEISVFEILEPFLSTSRQRSSQT